MSETGLALDTGTDRDKDKILIIMGMRTDNMSMRTQKGMKIWYNVHQSLHVKSYEAPLNQRACYLALHSSLWAKWHS